MKKNIVLLFVLICFVFITSSGFRLGPAKYGAGNGTGSTGGPKSCGGSGCHGNNSNNTLDTITVIDKTTGAPTLSYKPGQTYTVMLTGTNSSSLPKFGFQVSATLIDHSQAGTMIVTTAPNTQATTVGSITIIENSNNIDAVSGRYMTQFDWTAPPTGSGYVTFYGILCAVDGDGYATNSDIPNPANDVILHEWTSAVETYANNEQVKIYPNPFKDYLRLDVGTATGDRTVRLFNISGAAIVSTNSFANNATFDINTSSWAKGIYIVQITKEGIAQTMQVIKQ